MMSTIMEGFMWGAISAASLPIGSLIGIWKDPGKKVTSFLMAFGGGALLFALTLELFGEAIYEHSHFSLAQVLSVMCPSAIAGGVMFVTLNRLMSNWGGFMRKVSTQYDRFKQMLGKSDIIDMEEREGLLKQYKDELEPETFAQYEAEKSHKNVGLAIWLGILIDGFPESLIIGMLTSSETGISLAFVVGVFLSNFPEAMSSSVQMTRHGMSKTKVFIMWASLCVLTGIGAGVGAAIFQSPGSNMLLFNMAIEGLAAGAMLTMIAQTMLPEAFALGGEFSGIATLLGFLAAVCVKLMDED